MSNNSSNIRISEGDVLESSSLSFMNMDVHKNRFPNYFEFDTKFNDPYMVFRFHEKKSGLVNLSFNLESSKDITGQVYWRFGDDEFKLDRSRYFDSRKGFNSCKIDIGYVENIDRLRVEFSNKSGSFKVSNFKVTVASVDENIKNILAANKSSTKTNNSQLLEWSDSRFKWITNSSVAAVLVVQIPFDSGWAVKVDNVKSGIIRVDGGLIGVLLKPGTHNVDLTYTPPFFYYGLLISLVSFLLIALFFIYLKKCK